MTHSNERFLELYDAAARALHAIAHRMLAAESSRTTIQTTDLMHQGLEEFLGADADQALTAAGLPSLAQIAADGLQPEHVSRFIGVVAMRMRNKLRDRADRKRAIKRGRGWKREDLDDLLRLFDSAPERLVEVIDELELLRSLSPTSPELGPIKVARPARAAAAFELHHFGRLPVRSIAQILLAEDRLSPAQIATELDVSVVTVRSDIAQATDWLAYRLAARD